MWREKSLKISDGRSETLSSYTEDSTLYLSENVFCTYIFTEHPLQISASRDKNHFIYECFIEHLGLNTLFDENWDVLTNLDFPLKKSSYFAAA